MLYIKAPKALAEYLNLVDSRSTFADGSYLLWDRDLMRLTGSGTIEELLPQVGSIILTAPEVRAEQNEECQPHPLPPVTLPLILEYMQSHGYPLPESDPQEEQPESESGEPDQEEEHPESESGESDQEEEQK